MTCTNLDGLTGERPEELRRMEAYARRHSFPIIGFPIIGSAPGVGGCPRHSGPAIRYENEIYP
ncbi:MAG: hypothetical protein ACLFSP_09740, partial [Spirochaetaceae bacterium]